MVRESCVSKAYQSPSSTVLTNQLRKMVTILQMTVHEYYWIIETQSTASLIWNQTVMNYK